jgi:hypothetical protein
VEDLRSLIREILSDELSALKGNISGEISQVKEEFVQIQSSSDLISFTHRIMRMCQDPKLKSDILTGKHIFRLTDKEVSHVEVYQPLSTMTKINETVELNGGIITLRDVESLSKNTKSLNIGKFTNCTPMAKDEIKRRNIKIEREIK